MRTSSALSHASVPSTKSSFSTSSPHFSTKRSNSSLVQFWMSSVMAAEVRGSEGLREEELLGDREPAYFQARL